MHSLISVTRKVSLTSALTILKGSLRDPLPQGNQPDKLWQQKSGLSKQMKGSVKEPNKFHNYETEKITRKASDAAEYIELFGSFT